MLEGHFARHVSRDSTAIEGRESRVPKPARTPRSKRRIYAYDLRPEDLPVAEDPLFLR